MHAVWFLKNIELKLSKIKYLILHLQYQVLEAKQAKATYKLYEK